ncbi:MAG: MFS transporter [Chloroflexi bacterium]|nr:MAG: MFS transporter [Chloroflexota bacterium]
MLTSQAEQRAPGLSLASARGRWVLFATVLGSGIAFLDGTVVNVALPSISRDFHVGLADLQWTSTGYTLTLSAFLLLGGSLGDRYGRRRLFVVGVVWFTAASLVCGLAPSSPMLIAARALQGVGGALLTPASLAIIEATFRSDDRGAAIGAWSGLGGVFGAIGPLLGGFLVGAVSWRLVFFINLPIAAITVAVAARHVPETSQSGERGPLDIPGPVLAALGLGGVTYGLIEGSAMGWGSPAVLIAIAAGAALLGVFLVNERRQSDPLMPLDIFRVREFAGANAATFAIYGALGAVLFLVVIQLQQVLHYTPLQAGAALLPLTLLLLALSSRTGRLATRIGPRIPMTVGPLLAAAGMAMFARVGAGATYAGAVLPAAIVFGLGLVITVPALTTTAMGAVGAERAGIASAVNNDVARAASLVAVAVVPALAGISNAGSAINVSAFSSGFRTAMFICAGLCAAGGVISWALIRGPQAAAVSEQHNYSCPLTGPPASETAHPPAA